MCAKKETISSSTCSNGQGTSKSFVRFFELRNVHESILKVGVVVGVWAIFN